MPIHIKGAGGASASSYTFYNMHRLQLTYGEDLFFTDDSVTFYTHGRHDNKDVLVNFMLILYAGHNTGISTAAVTLSAFGNHADYTDASKSVQAYCSVYNPDYTYDDEDYRLTTVVYNIEPLNDGTGRKKITLSKGDKFTGFSEFLSDGTYSKFHASVSYTYAYPTA